MKNDIPEEKCPVCDQDIVRVTATGKIAPHNVGWTKPENGIQYPVRCAGGGEPGVDRSAQPFAEMLRDGLKR